MPDTIKISDSKARELRDRADELNVVPRLDALTSICEDAVRRAGMDAQVAPIWAEKLRHTYTKLLEVEFPELMAANGQVLPIDSSVNPAMIEWEYFMVEQTGYADWIGEDGQVAPGSAIKVKRFTGVMDEIGHRYDLNFFDIERASATSFPLAAMKQKMAKRAIDAKTNWVWLFGAPEKGIEGLCNHPNISKSLAALNTGETSRLWANKTNNEIVDDIVTLVNRIPDDTLEQEHAAIVYMPPALIRLCIARKLSGGGSAGGAEGDSGFASLWEYIKALYSGDDSGQGKVDFRALNECDANRRLNPVTATDDSGITGDFLLAIPAQSDELQFVRARPMTQRPPQERDFVMHHLVHSKIGGCKCQKPLAVHRMEFGTT